MPGRLWATSTSTRTGGGCRKVAPISSSGPSVTWSGVRFFFLTASSFFLSFASIFLLCVYRLGKSVWSWLLRECCAFSKREKRRRRQKKENLESRATAEWHGGESWFFSLFKKENFLWNSAGRMKTFLSEFQKTLMNGGLCRGWKWDWPCDIRKCFWWIRRDCRFFHRDSSQATFTQLFRGYVADGGFSCFWTTLSLSLSLLLSLLSLSCYRLTATATHAVLGAFPFRHYMVQSCDI